jgi:hypothetical protein
MNILLVEDNLADEISAKQGIHSLFTKSNTLVELLTKYERSNPLVTITTCRSYSEFDINIKHSYMFDLYIIDVDLGSEKTGFDIANQLVSIFGIDVLPHIKFYTNRMTDPHLQLHHRTSWKDRVDTVIKNTGPDSAATLKVALNEFFRLNSVFCQSSSLDTDIQYIIESFSREIHNLYQILDRPITGSTSRLYDLVLDCLLITSSGEVVSRISYPTLQQRLIKRLKLISNTRILQGVFKKIGNADAISQILMSSQFLQNMVNKSYEKLHKDLFSRSEITPKVYHKNMISAKIKVHIQSLFEYWSAVSYLNLNTVNFLIEKHLSNNDVRSHYENLAYIFAFRKLVIMHPQQFNEGVGAASILIALFKGSDSRESINVDAWTKQAFSTGMGISTKSISDGGFWLYLRTENSFTFEDVFSEQCCDFCNSK